MVQDSRLTILGQEGPDRIDRRSVAASVSAGSVYDRCRSRPEGAISGESPVPQSLYIHVPFCFHKCHYCDFYSFVDNRDQQPAFVDRLIRELEALGAWSRHATLQTIFVGGGTPSLLRSELWIRLLEALNQHFDLSKIHAGRGEFTVECNPETVSAELMGVLRGGGVDRVSIGAQSFHRAHLKTLERWHDPENVGRAVGLARAAGIKRQSIDLINSIPGQSMEDWAADLDRALALNVSHLSCYTLTYEAGTAMTKRLEMGSIEPASDELEARMYEHTLDRLRGAGFARYEVSNFARSVSDQSLHNLAYWRQQQWLAAGPSASGHLWHNAAELKGNGRSSDMQSGSWRWKNVPRLGDYLAFDDRGHGPAVDVEEPDPIRLLRERIMMGLRLEEGLNATTFMADVMALCPERAGTLDSMVHRYREEGLMYREDDRRGGRHERWTLTDRGVLLADLIASGFMSVLD